MPKHKDPLEQAHPVYKDNIKEWHFFNDSYIGGKQYIQSKEEYLIRHARENTSLFKIRKDRAFFVNYCQAIIDTYKSHLNRETPRVEVDADGWEEFEKDVNRKNDSLIEFRHDWQVMAMNLGHTFVIVDKPNVDAQTRAEELENGMPFFTHVPPWAVIDWALDDFGKPYWVKIIEDDRSVEPDPFKLIRDGQNKTDMRGMPVIKIWFRDRWERFDSEGKLIDKGDNPLGEVPIVIVLNKKSALSAMIGISCINDIAYINKRIYNLGSLIDEFAYMSAFPMIKNPKQMNQKGEGAELIGTSVLFNYPDTAKHSPEWMSPPTEPMAFLSEEIEDSIAEMQRLSRMEAGFDLRKRNNESGVAKAFDWLSASAVLSEKARNFEEAEGSMIRLWLKWQGDDTSAFEVAYSDTFDVKSLERDLDDTMTIQTMEISPTFEANQLKHLVRKADPNLDEDELIEIDDEIDESVNSKFEERAFVADANKDLDDNEEDDEEEDDS